MRSYTPRHHTRSNPDPIEAATNGAEVQVQVSQSTFGETAYAFLRSDTLLKNLSIFGVNPTTWVNSVNLMEANRGSELYGELLNSFFPKTEIKSEDAREAFAELGEVELTVSDDALIKRYAQALLSHPEVYFDDFILEPLKLEAEVTEFSDEIDAEKGDLAEIYRGVEGQVFVDLASESPSYEYVVIDSSDFINSEPKPILAVLLEDAAFAYFNNEDTAIVDAMFPVSATSSELDVPFAIVAPELYNYQSESGETIRAGFYEPILDLYAYISLLLENELARFGSLTQGASVNYLLRDALTTATRVLYNYYSQNSKAFADRFPDKIALSNLIPRVLRLFDLAEFPTYRYEALVELYERAAVQTVEGTFDPMNIYQSLIDSFHVRLCKPQVKPIVLAQIQKVSDIIVDDTIIDGFNGLCALRFDILRSKLLELDGFEKLVSGGDVGLFFEFRGEALRLDLASKNAVSDDGKVNQEEIDKIFADKTTFSDDVVGDVAGKGVKVDTAISTSQKVMGGVALAGSLVGLYALVRHAQGKQIWSFK